MRLPPNDPPQFPSSVKYLLATLLLTTIIPRPAAAQTPDPWRISADTVDPRNYYGATVANGMLGVVSSAEPFQVKSVVLAGAYDQYGRGRVSNFLNSFNLERLRRRHNAQHAIGHGGPVVVARVNFIGADAPGVGRRGLGGGGLCNGEEQQR